MEISVQDLLPSAAWEIIETLKRNDSKPYRYINYFFLKFINSLIELNHIDEAILFLHDSSQYLKGPFAPEFYLFAINMITNFTGTEELYTFLDGYEYHSIMKNKEIKDFDMAESNFVNKILEPIMNSKTKTPFKAMNENFLSNKNQEIMMNYFPTSVV